jgi:hypothetical protein
MRKFRIAACGLRICALALCTLLISSTASATTIVKLDLPQLVRESDSIVQGRIDNVYSQWDAQLKVIFTYVSVHIDDPLKGQPRQSVLIRQLGGKVGALNMSIPGMPRFNNGDEVIVFLKGNPEGTYHVVGLNQGKYEVIDDFAISNVSGVSLVDVKTRQVIDGPLINREPLESLKSRIRELAR